MDSFEHAVDNRTSLSLIGLDDAAEIFSLVDVSRLHLRPWLPWVDTTMSIADIEAFIYGAIKQNDEGQGFHCCIRYDNRTAGVIGYHRLDETSKTTELGYWLGDCFQGRGIMLNCSRFLIEFAFTHLKLHKVEIRVAYDNLRSRAIPEGLGFTCEGVLRDAQWDSDCYLNNIVYFMLQEKWCASR